MKKILFILIVFFGFSSAAHAAFSYPVDQIAKPSCRKEAWSSLGADCKITLPKITGAEYSKLKTDTQYRRIYTVLWGATYTYGWDIGYGSHLGVDIATSAGTPVLAIGDGTVMQAANASGWGKYITIRHTLADGTKIFSNYAHLSELSVTKGDTVRQGQKIGAVGTTGNSTGNHLHFQIDITDQLHPYYYVTCGKGKQPQNIVDTGDCRSYLLANTIDPIQFLETGRLTTIPTVEIIEIIKEKPVEKIERNTIKSREEIMNEEALEYLQFYKLSVGIATNGATVNMGNILDFRVQSVDSHNKPARGGLPDVGLSVVYDKSMATVFPERINLLENGERWMQVIPKKTGTVELIFKLGKTEITRKKVYIVAKGAKIEATGAKLKTPRQITLGQEHDMYITPTLSNGTYVGTKQYNARFRVYVNKGKAKFCTYMPPPGANCDPKNVVEILEFGSKETSSLGYVGTHIIPLDSSPIEVGITLVGKVGNVDKTRVVVKHPVGIDRRYLYYDTTISGVGKNWWKVRNNYVGQDLTLTTEITKELIDRLLAYNMLRAGNDSAKKQAAKNAIELWGKSSAKLQSKTWSRAEFSDILLKSLRIPVSEKPAVWNDEKGAYQSTMATLRSKYKFRWQDSFGETYFQPEKIITVGEALYLMGVVVK